MTEVNIDPTNPAIAELSIPELAVYADAFGVDPEARDQLVHQQAHERSHQVAGLLEEMTFMDPDSPEAKEATAQFEQVVTSLGLDRLINTVYTGSLQKRFVTQRLQAGVSQVQAAQALGISPSYLSHIEKGNRRTPGILEQMQGMIDDGTLQAMGGSAVAAAASEKL